MTIIHPLILISIAYIGLASNAVAAVNSNNSTANSVENTMSESNQEQPKIQGSETKQKMDQVNAEINRIIGNATCTSNDQCASLAIGAKACGGPISYRPYSKLNTNTEELLTLAQHYKVLNQQYNKENGLMSDCMMATPSALSCINNSCTRHTKP